MSHQDNVNRIISLAQRQAHAMKIEMNPTIGTTTVTFMPVVLVSSEIDQETVLPSDVVPVRTTDVDDVRKLVDALRQPINEDVLANEGRQATEAIVRAFTAYDDYAKTKSYVEPCSYRGMARAVDAVREYYLGLLEKESAKEDTPRKEEPKEEVIRCDYGYEGCTLDHAAEDDESYQDELEEPCDCGLCR